MIFYAWRIAVLVFSGFLVWVFNNPYYLWFLALLLITPKKPRKTIEQHFEHIDAKLNDIYAETVHNNYLRKERDNKQQ